MAQDTRIWNRRYKRSISRLGFLIDGDEFPAAAAFFSRAFCEDGYPEEDLLPVPDGYNQKTVATIRSLFELFKIVREPQWVQPINEDWVDNLEHEAKAVKTVGDWRHFEKRWAIITSYACGLILHQGPWAGEEWRSYIDGGK